MNEENKKTEVEYIISQRKKGGTDEAIKKELLEAGWTEEDIAIGFVEVDKKELTQKTEAPIKDKTEEKPEVHPGTPPSPSKNYDPRRTKVVSADEVVNPVVKIPESTGESIIKTAIAVIIGLLILGGVSAAVYFLLGLGSN